MQGAEQYIQHLTFTYERKNKLCLHIGLYLHKQTLERYLKKKKDVGGGGAMGGWDRGGMEISPTCLFFHFDF